YGLAISTDLTPEIARILVTALSSSGPDSPESSVSLTLPASTRDLTLSVAGFSSRTFRTSSLILASERPTSVSLTFLEASFVAPYPPRQPLLPPLTPNSPRSPAVPAVLSAPALTVRPVELAAPLTAPVVEVVVSFTV